MHKPFFSILIPVYNVEKYLVSCLESILEQQYKDYEIILVDDGSTDQSPVLCDKYAEENPEKIKVLHKKNEGQLSARLEAIKLANGYYTCFVDSDDGIASNMLSSLHETIGKYQTDIVIFNCNRINENGKAIGSMEPMFDQTGFIDKRDVYIRLLERPYNALWYRCYKTTLLDLNSDYRPYYHIRNGEDLLQTVPIIEKAETFYYLKEELYEYRVNPKSTTQTFNYKKYQSLECVRPSLYESAQRMGYVTTEVKLLFFYNYLESLLSNTQELFLGTNNKKIIEDALNTMRAYEYVIKAEKYVDSYKANKIKKIGLKLFYTNKKLFWVYMKLYKHIIERKNRHHSRDDGKERR